VQPVARPVTLASLLPSRSRSGRRPTRSVLAPVHAPKCPDHRDPALAADLGYVCPELSPRADFLPFFFQPRADRQLVSAFRSSLRSAASGSPPCSRPMAHPPRRSRRQGLCGRHQRVVRCRACRARLVHRLLHRHGALRQRHTLGDHIFAASAHERPLSRELEHLLGSRWPRPATSPDGPPRPTSNRASQAVPGCRAWHGG